jgi:hypothetical protein
MESSKRITNQLKEDQKVLETFLKQQESATTITVTGPSGSAKSTLLAEVLPTESNKLFGHNIGETAQTSLLATKLMLNGQLSETEVIIQCIERKDSIAIDFQSAWRSVLIKSIYDSRDELYDFELGESSIKKIINPINRSYHAYQFAKEHNLTESLLEILNNLCKITINNPAPIDEVANGRFKELRVRQPKIKKSEVYAQLLDERIFEQDLCKTQLQQLVQWLGSLKEAVRVDLSSLWTYPKESILIGEIAEGSAVNILIEKLYSQDSACSILFEELRYVTSPSEEFKASYGVVHKDNPGRTVKLNILDTVGLTQTSEDSEQIGDAMDKIFSRNTDAILFLCSADERPTVYQECISLLRDRQDKLQNIPVIICRTKADIVIRNILINEWRKKNGSNFIPDDSEEYASYVQEAFETFMSEYICSNSYAENTIGKSSIDGNIEFLSMAPDLSSKMNSVLNNRLNPKHVFEILLNMSKQVDLIYSEGTQRPWLQSINPQYYPLSVIINAKPLLHTTAMALTACNARDNKQYSMYIAWPEIFHGRSVTTFISKLSYGEGHETRAYSYGNFKLFIKSMVLRWLRSIVPMKDLISNFDVHFENLDPENSEADRVKVEFPQKFRELATQRTEEILNHLAKQLSYDCLKEDFDNCYYYQSWDKGLRVSLELFNQKFGSPEYWQKFLYTSLQKEMNDLLQKMYIYD